MKNFLFCLLVTIASSTLCGQSQEEFRAKYNAEVITVVTNIKFLKGEKEMSRKEVRELLMKYPESAAEYKLFQKKQKIANALNWTGIGLYIGSFPLLGVNEGAALGTFIVGGAAVFTALPFGLKAHRHLLKAVYLYNREVLLNS